MATGPHLRSVNASIRAVGSTNDPRNAALVALTRTYARHIDAAGDLAALVAALPTPNDGNDRQALDAMRRRVSEEQTVADFGPKLLAALTALRLSPAPFDRSRLRPVPAATPAGRDPARVLEELRVRARARRDGLPLPETGA